MKASSYKAKNLKVTAKKLIELGEYDLVKQTLDILSELDEDLSVGEHYQKYYGNILLDTECLVESYFELEGT